MSASGDRRAVHWTSYANHYGLDFPAVNGTRVQAVEDGTLFRAAYNNSLGHLVIIDHGDGYFSFYAHLSGYAEAFDGFRAKIREGTIPPSVTVSKGDTIGFVGNSGRSEGSHLHFVIAETSANEINRTGALGQFESEISLFRWSQSDFDGRNTQYKAVQSISPEIAKIADHPEHRVDLLDTNGLTSSERGFTTWDVIEDNLKQNTFSSEGIVERSMDNDYFRLDLAIGHQYAIKVAGKESYSFQGLPDPIFNIYTSNGSKVTTWDRTDVLGKNERRYFEIDDGKDYFLKVAAGGKNYREDLGAYEVVVQRIESGFVGKDIVLSPSRVVEDSLDIFNFVGDPTTADWDFYIIWDNETGGGFFEADGDRLPARHWLFIGERELETSDSEQSSDIFLSVTAVGDDWSDWRRVEDLDYVAPSEVGYENVFAVYYDPETGWDDWVQSNVIVSDDLIA